MADSKQLFDDPEDLTMDDSEWDVESDASALITHARKRSATEALDFEKYMDNNEGFLVEDPNMSSYNYEDSMISDSFNKEADGDIDNNNHNNSGDNNNNNDDDDDDDNNNNTNNNNNDDIKDSAAEEDATLGEYQKLKNELATIQSMTSAIEKITANFKVSQQGMIQFTETIIRTDQLLDTWIRLLSQAEYTKSLLQNEQWHGVSMVSFKSRQSHKYRQFPLGYCK
ncbi:DASH complex subunit Duo1-domain-containing protein [Syncephalis fuscata]|nr:DASH complex subunit Duo1-domain-containing protein [Syncephalis fuscata]